MTFKEIQPSRVVSTEYNGNKVKIAFPLTQKPGKKPVQSMILQIGKDIAKALGLKHGDKVQLFVDDENPLLWFLKKSESNLSGWTLIDIYKSTGSSNSLFRLQMTWKEAVPAKFLEAKSLFASHSIYEGGIKIALPGCNINELSL